MDSQIFKTLRQAKSASQIANDFKGRSPFFTLGIITDNADPLNKRRVRCTLQSKGGQTQTDWLYRLTASPFEDPPIPRIGQTVGVMFVDGDPHTGVYFGAVTNLPNPQRETGAPIEDDSRYIEGDRIEDVEGSESLTVTGDRTTVVKGNHDEQVAQDQTVRADLNHTTEAGLQVLIKNDAGASILLHPSGAVVIASATGQRIVLGGAGAIAGVTSNFLLQTGGQAGTWDVQGGAINLINAADFTVTSLSSGGASVATIGAVDTDSDTLVTRGW